MGADVHIESLVQLINTSKPPIFNIFYEILDISVKIKIKNMKVLNLLFIVSLIVFTNTTIAQTQSTKVTLEKCTNYLYNEASISFAQTNFSAVKSLHNFTDSIEAFSEKNTYYKDKFRLPIVSVVLILSILLFFMIYKGLDIKYFWLKVIVLFTISILEIIHFVVLGAGTWFCSFGKVGFIMTIVNFILFCGVIATQIFASYGTLENFQDKSKEITYNISIYSLAIGIPTLLIAAFFVNGEIEVYMLSIIIAFQIAQIIRIALSSKANWEIAIVHALFYLIVGVAVLITLFKFILLLIIAVIACVVLGGFSSSSSSSSRIVGPASYAASLEEKFNNMSQSKRYETVQYVRCQDTDGRCKMSPYAHDEKPFCYAVSSGYKACYHQDSLDYGIRNN